MDNTTRFRRLRGVVKSFCALDFNDWVTDAELRQKIETLQKRAGLALEETKLGRGNPVNLDVARRNARKTHRLKGQATEDRVRPIIARLRAEGFVTYRALAAELDRMKVRPPEAKTWSPRGVHAIETRHLK